MRSTLSMLDMMADMDVLKLNKKRRNPLFIYTKPLERKGTIDKLKKIDYNIAYGSIK